jgi:hypothetical protein
LVVLSAVYNWSPFPFFLLAQKVQTTSGVVYEGICHAIDLAAGKDSLGVALKKAYKKTAASGACAQPNECPALSCLSKNWLFLPMLTTVAFAVEPCLTVDKHIFSAAAIFVSWRVGG